MPDFLQGPTLASYGLSGAVIVHAVARSGSAWRSRHTAGIPPFAVSLLWLGVSLGALATHHLAWSPRTHPVATLLALTAILGVPAAVAERSAPFSTARRTAAGVRTAAIIAGLGVAGLAVAEWMIWVRPAVGGADFFYYVCHARDVRDGFGDQLLSRYLYFPGVYSFWQAVISVVGEALLPLQATHLTVLWGNAVLVGVVIARLLSTSLAAIHGAFWYLTLCSRFEGAAGTSEPIATLPVLIALAVWGGAPLQGRRGAFHAAVLGVGFGLALYVKQQGGLLALGAGALVIHAIFAGPKRRPGLGHLLLIPLASASAFLLGIALEGQGYLPIAAGLGHFAGYEVTGSFADNSRDLIDRGHESLAAGALALVFWLVAVAHPSLRRRVPDTWASLGGVSLLAATAALIQFRTRDYLHYALAVLPFLVVGASTAAVIAGRLLPRQIRIRPLARWLVVPLAAFPLVQSGFDAEYLRPWMVPSARRGTVGYLFAVPGSVKGTRKNTDLLLDSPRFAADLERVAVAIPPRHELLVLPTRMTEVHFRLRTRPPASLASGYSFGASQEAVGLAMSRPESPPPVLVVHSRSTWDNITWSAAGQDQIARQLPAIGYERALDLPSMTLWRHR